jgi:hypothetical protein
MNASPCGAISCRPGRDETGRHPSAVPGEIPILPWNTPWNNSVHFLYLYHRVMPPGGCDFRSIIGGTAAAGITWKHLLPWSMPSKLTSEQIRGTCQELLKKARSTTVREVMAQLRREYGACGRTERVKNILQDVLGEWRPEVPVVEDANITLLRQKLSDAEARAARAEELERRHQDFWAARYAERVAELENRAPPPAPTGVSTEKYVRLYRRAAELWDRLARYEEVGPLLPPPGTPERR